MSWVFFFNALIDVYATYEQVGDELYYIDTTMYDWFQEINGNNNSVVN